MPSTAKNLIEMLESSVREYSDRPALFDPSGDTYRRWTYRELWRDIYRVAGHVDQIGVHKGDKIGLLSHSRACWTIADFAIMSLGACTVPIYPSLPANQVEHIVRHSGMRGIFVQDEGQLEKLLGGIHGTATALEFVVLFEQATSKEIVSLAQTQFKVFDITTWLAEETVPEQLWRARWEVLARSDLATIVYTSGTTGVPKGAMLSHGNLLSNVEGIRPIVALQPTDQSLSYLPLSHIFERTAGQMVTLHAGGAIAYSRGMTHILEDFKNMPPTILTTVPRLLEKVREGVLAQAEAGPNWKRAIFRRALQTGIRARVDKKPVSKLMLRLYDKLVFEKIHQATGGRLSTIVSGGAPLPYHVGVFFAAAGFTVVEGYGMTETSPVVAVNPPNDPMLGTVGKILHNVRVKFAEDGELLVQGPSVMQGYYEDEVATQEAFTNDGWLHTGDIGELADNGYLRITDRKKNLVVLSTGKKVTPAPIEAAILESLYIDQALLLGQDRKYISVLIVPNDEMVRTWLSEHGYPDSSLARYRELAPLNDFLLSEVQRNVQDYAKFEQPKKLLIAREPFTIENQMLTPTLKLRAKNILTAYHNDIQLLYADETTTTA